MPVQLYFSNSPAILLDRLAQNLDWTDPFRSPLIATPTPAMKRWVQVALAEKLGIVANVRFQHLERTLWRRLEDLDQEHLVESRQPARLLDERGLQILILSLLRRDPPAEAREYLEDGGPEPALRSLRLCQLSQKLAGLFREYEYNRVQEHGRQGLARLWMHNEPCFADLLKRGAPKEVRAQVERLERWQKTVYYGLFRKGGLRDRLGEATAQYGYTLPQYTEMVLAQPRLAEGRSEAPVHHLFGLSQISPFHRSLIHRLSDEDALPGHYAVFHVYALNPCAEYWEDALDTKSRLRLQGDLLRQQKYQAWQQLTASEKQKIQLERAKILNDELPEGYWENPLLGQWGKLGRESIQLWNQRLEYDFEARYDERPAVSLLSAVQDAILKRHGRLPAEDRRAQDASLRILACPEIHREVETVHQCIVADLLADPELRPDEIAVLVPDMVRYRHVLSAVFERTAPGDPGHVPHALTETSASAESAYARAIRCLFDLARGRFSRKELLALAANPCFREARGLDEESLRAWLRWSRELNVFHGFDAADKARRGYPPEETHSWSHALERLALGTVMESPRDGDLRHFDDLVPYADGSSPDRDLLDNFFEVVTGLHRDLAPLRGESRPWGEWIDLLGRILDAWLDIPVDDALESFVRAEVRRYLAELQNLEALEALWDGPTSRGDGRLGSPPGDSQPLPVSGRALSEGARVPADLPMNLLLSRLEGLKAGRESGAFGGVRIAGLSALRSLPFRRVYVVGLGEGEFPEDVATSTLDLRQYRRVIGDVDPAARNRYLFLETLVCAGESLCLSYVSRDVQQGKVFQMSSVLNELVDYLEAGVLPAGERFRVTQVPLLSRSPELFAPIDKPWSPPRSFSREDRFLEWLERKRREFEKASGGAEGGFQAFLRAGLPERWKREVFPSLPILSLAPGAAAGAGGKAPDSETIKVRLTEVSAFLKNPVEYTLRYHLKVNDWREEDGSDLEDEPFFTHRYQEWRLLEKVYEARLRCWKDPVPESLPEFDAQYAAFARQGHMPEGHYRAFDRETQKRKAGAAAGAMQALLDRMRGKSASECRLNLAFGEPSRHFPVEEAFPAVRIDGVPGVDRPVELHGHLPCLFRLQPGGCAAVLALPYKLKRHRLLSPFLFYLAGCQSDSDLGNWLRSGPFTIHYVQPSEGRESEGNWPPFEVPRQASLDYLRGVLGSMLARRDFDDLPFQLVAERLAEKGRLADRPDYAEVLREALEEAYTSDFGGGYAPKESVRILDPRVPDDALAKVQARLNLFFNWK